MNASDLQTEVRRLVGTADDERKAELARLAKAMHEAEAAFRDEIEALGEQIVRADGLLAQLAALEGHDAERDKLLATMRPLRARFFALMEEANPDQAWFWTEEWQAKEREVDADRAAGRTGTFYPDGESFLASLRGRMHADV